LMFRITQSWFVLLYVLTLVTSIVTRHHWRFFAANIASMATIVAVAASGIPIRASLAMHPIDLQFLPIELPYNLSYFPICLFLAFAASLYLCDTIGTDVFGKRLLRKALIATSFSCVSFVYGMVMYLAFGYVVIAVSHFTRLFLSLLLIAAFAQFCFTMFGSILDTLFVHVIRRFRPLYVILFIITPLLYTYGAYEFYMHGMLGKTVTALGHMIEPLTFGDLSYVGIAAVAFLLVYIGMASTSAYFTRDAVLTVMHYLLAISVPVASIFVYLLNRRRLNCHRAIIDFFQTRSGLFTTVFVMATTIIVLILPFIVGHPLSCSKCDKKKPAKKADKKTKVKSE